MSKANQKNTWSAARLREVLEPKEATKLLKTRNFDAIYIMVQPYVVTGQCSFEHFVACYDGGKGSSWTIEEAVRTFKKPPEK